MTLTVHNVTTARDLVPPRKGETRRRTLGERRTGLASNNTRTIGRLNAGPGRNAAVITLYLIASRVDTNLPPEALRFAAESAAHSGDLRSRLTADLAAHGSFPWDELRVWDPGD